MLEGFLFGLGLIAAFFVVGNLELVGAAIGVALGLGLIALLFSSYPALILVPIGYGLYRLVTAPGWFTDKGPRL
jgi:hypothetical protein